MQFLKVVLFGASLFAGVEAALQTFNFSLSEGFAAPDGYIRRYSLINGQSPGPTIVLDQGDQVEVIVTNTAAENATIHFHGMHNRLPRIAYCQQA